MTNELISYSQIAEDILLRRALIEVKNGFYIDLGAWDPDIDSVTKIFYDAGWTGINVEPNPRYFAKLEQKRSRDVNLDIAVSDTEKDVELSIVGETGLSSLDADIANSHGDNYGFAIETVAVKAVPLRKLWDEHVPADRDVHFLKIDVEGAEADVIKSADWTLHRPWILMIESTLPRSTVQNHHDWEPTILASDYIYAYFDGLNRFYVAKEKKELLAAFEIPLNVATDNYVPLIAHMADQRFKQASASLEALTEEHNRLALKASVLETCFENRSKPLWERLLFRSNGKPKKPLRKLFFHKNGKPRGVFRKFIVTPDGVPKSPFFSWMNSPAYQELQAAVRLPYGRQARSPQIALSKRGTEIISRLQNAAANSGQNS